MSDGKKLLASVLETGSTETLRQVDRSLFEDDEVAVFDFIALHYRRYRELPTFATVESEARTRMPQAPEATAYYLKRLYDRRLFVTIREGFGQLRDALQAFDVDESRAIIDSLKSSCRVATPQDDLRNIREAAQSVLRTYVTAHENPGVNGITTGWPFLDTVTGGYQNGDLIAWVARMGVGKTYALISQAQAARRAGHSVLFVTMEMNIEQIMRRMMALEVRVAPDYIRKGMLSTQAYARLQAYVDTMSAVESMMFYSGQFSAKLSDIDLVMAEVNADINYIDGAYLCQPDTAPKNANRIEKVGEVFNGLKRMTITHNRPVVTSTQFNRQAGKRGKDGSLENISFSDTIAQNASLVFGLKEGNPPYQTTRRAVDILKGREGESGSFEFNYRFDPMDFSEVAPEQAAAEAVDIDWMG